MYVYAYIYIYIHVYIYIYMYIYRLLEVSATGNFDALRGLLLQK